jgi:hypothetical protein
MGGHLSHLLSPIAAADELVRIGRVGTVFLLPDAVLAEIFMDKFIRLQHRLKFFVCVLAPVLRFKGSYRFIGRGLRGFEDLPWGQMFLRVGRWLY